MYELRIKSFKKTDTYEYVRVYGYEFYSSKLFLATVLETANSSGTTFSNFGDEVWWKEVPATDVASPHSRACTKGPISSLAKYWINGKVRS